MAKLENCNRCGEKLVEGPDHTASVFTHPFKCTIKNIPTKVCPNTCPGKYWNRLDLGAQVFGLFASPENIAKRKFGFFKYKNICRNCNSELIDKQATGKFLFKGSGDLELEIEGPALSCINCEEKFIPVSNGDSKKYYKQLGDIISEAMTKDLISE